MGSRTATLLQPVQKSLGSSIPGALALLFVITSFLSAFLLFQVQLIVSKHILPWFGGTAAVWTTCMLVFQLLLLAGYVYSHLISAKLSPAAQTRLHLGLLAVALLVVLVLSILWPSAVTPGRNWKLEGGSPVLRVALLIMLATGLPFFVLSTTGPLLQSWYARLGGGTRAYKLYAISNLGSFLGLLTFPFLLEPMFRLRTLGLTWSVLFAGFIAVCGLCAWNARNASHEASLPAEGKLVVSHGTGALVRSLWFLLAACASSLLLATTNLLCQEITSVPLLWVLPLALYLLSFILCFDNPRWYLRAVFQPLYALSLLAVCAALIFGPARLVLVPLTLFLTAMVCHGELARLKPSVEQLTSFYLTIACGGAAGGVFVAVVAPLVFRTFIEFHLSLAASAVLALICLGRDAESWLFERRFWLPAAISIGALLAGVAGSLWIEDLGKYLTSIRYYPSVLLVGFVAVMGSLATNNAAEPSRRGLRFLHILVVCGVLSIFASLYWTTRPLLRPLLKERNFYGAIRVESTKKGRILMHGATLHGAQLDPPFDKLPVAYYGPDSGIGTLLSGHPKRHSYPGNLRIGVIGLGVGTLSAYGRQGDYIRYYELDPNVVNLSLSQKPAFTYVRNSPARIDVALGDGRLLLEEEAARGELQYFDVLVLDAFSGDAIPVHLLTKEAFETYWQHVNPDSGIIAIHVSSRHVNLLPVALGIAEHFRASSVISMHEATDPFWTSWWVLLARRPATLAIPGLGQLILPDRIPTPSRLWTDDQSDIFRLIR